VRYSWVHNVGLRQESMSDYSMSAPKSLTHLAAGIRYLWSRAWPLWSSHPVDIATVVTYRVIFFSSAECDKWSWQLIVSGDNQLTHI